MGGLVTQQVEFKGDGNEFVGEHSCNSGERHDLIVNGDVAEIRAGREMRKPPSNGTQAVSDLILHLSHLRDSIR